MSVEAKVGAMAAAVNGRDIDAALAACHESIELVSAMAPAEGGDPYRGHAGIRQWWANTLETWADYRLEPAAALEIPPSHGLVAARLDGRGMTSGIPVQTALFLAVEIRDGGLFWVFAAFDAVPSLRALADRIEASA